MCGEYEYEETRRARALTNGSSWRRLGGHFEAGVGDRRGGRRWISPFVRLLLDLDEFFFKEELFFFQIERLGGADFGRLFELVRFEPNFGVLLLFS